MLIFTPDRQFEGPPDVETEEAERLGVTDAAFQLLSSDMDAGDLAARCAAIIIWHEVSLDAAAINAMPNCRIIVRAGVGCDNVDIEAAAARGIPVCNVPDYGTTDVADTALSLMLALRRGTTTFNARLKADPAGNWVSPPPVPVGRVRGGHFGVVGCGRIGTAALRRARIFDMAVGFFDPYLPDGAELGLGSHRFDTLQDLLAWSDCVSLHTPATKETTGMINDAAFSAMRPDAVLINTARGSVVDLDALERALRENRIAGAGLDVLPQEPPAPHPLLDAYSGDADWLDGRLILMPHMAWYSEASRHHIRSRSARTVLAYLKHGTLRNCVNGIDTGGP